jgi:hypothetical protein
VRVCERASGHQREQVRLRADQHRLHGREGEQVHLLAADSDQVEACVAGSPPILTPAFGSRLKSAGKSERRMLIAAAIAFSAALALPVEAAADAPAAGSESSAIVAGRATTSDNNGARRRKQKPTPGRRMRRDGETRTRPLPAAAARDWSAQGL